MAHPGNSDGTMQNRSVKQKVNRSVKQKVNRSVKQKVNRSVKQKVNRNTNKGDTQRKIMQKTCQKQLYVGIDLHKLSAQIAIVDSDNKLLQNEKVPNTRDDLKKNLSKLPEGTKCRNRVILRVVQNIFVHTG